MRQTPLERQRALTEDDLAAALCRAMHVYVGPIPCDEHRERAARMIAYLRQQGIIV